MNDNKLSRIVSFTVLIGIILVMGLLFFRVMASFVLPLFLAAVLVIVFQPTYGYFLRRFKGRRRWSASVTTTIIGLVVMLPIGLIIGMAVVEGANLTKKLTPAYIKASVEDIRDKLDLEMPHKNEFSAISAIFDHLSDKALAERDPLAVTVDVDAIKLNLQLIVENLTPDNKAKVNPELEVFNATLFAFSEEDNDHIETVVAATHAFHNFKTAILGGSTNAAILEFANPTDEKISQFTESLMSKDVRDQILSFGANTAAFAASLLGGMTIMLVGVYFFLIDGRGMVDSIMHLSPLRDDYENELITEFASLSRAVVVATLLSAVVQGILAGLGYWFAGLDSVFLLTIISTLFALVPFIGTAIVWIPACAYLYLVQGEAVSAIVLATYCATVVSMSDNFVKPLVLQKESNLHPLLALLSVIGGVEALGPIGILVGPMVVAFLQTLLKLLQRELNSFEQEERKDEEAATA
tara:strand:- start:3777 stop:5177 length:1401 start_codon:yes stop_codon:yes gene_type:complete